MKIPCPKNDDPNFKSYWDLMIDEVSSRPNFSNSHLLQFRILCDAYCQYDELKDLVKEEGYTLIKITERGETIVNNPNVSQLNRVVTQIRDYSKMLGLVLLKDDNPTRKQEDDEDWT